MGRKKKLWILGVATIILMILIVCVFALFSSDKRLQRQLDLGNKYLNELNYEQAVIAFDKAVAIDPASVEAYLGEAESYRGLGDDSMALEILEMGYTATRDMRLQKEIEMVEEKKEAAVYREARIENYHIREDGSEFLYIVFENVYDEAGYRIRCKEKAKGWDDESEDLTFDSYDDYYYDEAGNHVRTDFFNYGNGYEGYFKNEYDKEGKCVRESFYRYSDDEEVLVDQYENFYDDSGNLIRKNNSEFCENYVYDEADRLIRKESPSFEGDYYSEYLYDEDGRCIRENRYDPEDKLWSYTEKEYDEIGNLIEERTYYDGRLWEHVKVIWEEGKFIDSKTSSNWYGEYNDRRERGG